MRARASPILKPLSIAIIKISFYLNKIYIYIKFKSRTHLLNKISFIKREYN
uniref:Uncharacterized protein n=1 Tax=Phage sp. ctGns7 TaxID=2828003 RepID=A0A8S5S950_9VIRU|nr:MAG TPA: hypothetical protein [Phage sp. ctGns7]